MLERALAFARQYEMLPPPGGRILCAVSGGADSMCLLHWLSRLGEAQGFSVVAAHFNHAIRGSEADRDEAFVAHWCREQAIPFVSGREDVPAAAARQGRGLEETARRLRYAFLRQQAQAWDCCRLATAHQAQDNLETFFLHLLRGAALQGLTGISPRRGELVRPLLTTSREEILAYLEACSIPHREDSSNADPAYARNRIRRDLLPLLSQLRPDVVERLTGTISALREDNRLLEEAAACCCPEAVPGGACTNGAALAALPDPLALRAARQLLERSGEDVGYTAAHLRALVDLCRSPSPSGRVCLPGSRQAVREYDLLRVEPLAPAPTFSPCPVIPEGETLLPGWRLVCRRGVRPPGDRPTPSHFYLSLPALSRGALLRPRQEGDRIALPGRPEKSVKKLFIDRKLPRSRREAVPILVSPSALLAVGGLGCAAAFLAREGEEGWEIRIEEREKETEKRKDGQSIC